jgi:serine/threonine protein phosphatase 1
MGRFFAIGDIHGSYEKLRTLIGKIDIDYRNDTLVFLGDYIDRGTGSYDVVSYLIDLKKQHENIVLLKGNHEEMLEDYLKGKNRLTFLANGGQQTIDSYVAAGRSFSTELFPREHIDFFNSLELFYETDNYIFVHAGLRKNVSIAEQKQEDLLWIRSHFIKTGYDFGKRVVFGHTPLPEPLVQSNKIGIDTGAVYGNRLTCVALPELKFIST